MARPLVRSFLLATSFLYQQNPLRRLSYLPCAAHSPYSHPHFNSISRFHSSCSSRVSVRSMAPLRRSIAGRRPVRKSPRRKIGLPKLDVAICLEEDMPDDPLVKNIAETLKEDVPNAMKVAFESLKNPNYKTRDESVKNINKFQNIEISVLLCDDDFIKKLNQEWRGQDKVTDVLSMSQHIPGLVMPILLLGDIVISVDTAARQAEERGHSLLDEIRILVVHGLLHLLGFDHEISDEAEEEMGTEENRVLTSLEWKDKGLIMSAQDSALEQNFQESNEEIKKRSTLEAHEPKLSHVLFDIDDSTGLERSVEALKEAINRKAKIIIISGKSKNAIERDLDKFNLGECVLSSPGVFLQGALVYGRHGREIYKEYLDHDICREAFLYSLEKGVPLIAFCDDKCLALFEHPSIDSFHEIYNEPKATIVSSIENLLKYNVQKLLFMDTESRVSSILQPHWSKSVKGRANLVQSVPNMHEIVPLGASKGTGVKMILDHLGIISDEFEIGEEGSKWLLR